MTWHIDPAKATQLNLRKAPKPGDVITALAAGTNVTKISGHPTKTDWWLVDADVNGTTVRGYVHSGYLKSGSSSVPSPVVTGTIPDCHLRSNTGNKRTTDGGRAFPLDDSAMPQRPNKTAAELVAIINYLAPDKSTHLRYQAGSGKTYCNIYAYDYAQRCGVFLPRVWWTTNALNQILSGGSTPTIAYGTTVREMNANMIYDWFVEFGRGFGWSQVFNADDLQTAANSGNVAIIVAKRTNLAKSGHIVAVVPEHGGITAARSGGMVTRPVQSQAGVSNFTAKVTSTRWWLGSQFQNFGFWVHP